MKSALKRHPGCGASLAAIPAAGGYSCKQPLDTTSLYATIDIIDDQNEVDHTAYSPKYMTYQRQWAIMESSGTKRSTSASRNRPSSRPTTPLRPSSRTSLRDGQGFAAGSSSSEFPLESLEPAFAELSDSMADLEANFMHLQLMHESLSRFNESFASFLYGLNMNAFCVDFPEVCTGMLYICRHH